MLTVHAAPLVLPVGAAAVAQGAVAVDGDRIVALGPHDEVVAAHPAARVRQWPGVLTPGLRQWHAVWLLTRCYHPDPREADELGDRPLWGEAFERLAGEMDAARWAGSVRRGLQQMLRHGTTHLAGRFHDPAVRTAVDRSGLTEVSAVGAPGILVGEPSLDPFSEGYDLPGSVHGPLTVGGRADLAVFDVPDEDALCAAGAGACIATVLGGRLVYRRR
ncbi:imidazolonepropionase-like domain-containing protein [Streptomyces sp. NPDC056231]|uniref:imidazolonepropionase-like domain-containing protein n=1 Tax=Streptomyces sp. NPDC056231 TaxID=3345755 RepID=UPI003AAA7A54